MRLIYLVITDRKFFLSLFRLNMSKLPQIIVCPKRVPCHCIFTHPLTYLLGTCQFFFLGLRTANTLLQHISHRFIIRLQPADLLQGNLQHAQQFDALQYFHVLVGIVSITVAFPLGSEKSLLLVKSDIRSGQAGQFFHFTYVHLVSSPLSRS